MSNIPLRLIVSARDPGAAEQLAAIALRAREWGFTVLPLGSGPALHIMTQAGLAPLPFEAGPIHAGDQAEFALMAQEARNIVQRLKPDALIVGFSHSAEMGVDEALAAIAGTIPLFGFQDFWGELHEPFAR